MAGVSAEDTEYLQDQIRSLSLRVDSLERTLDLLMGGRTKVARAKKLESLTFTVRCPSCGAEAGAPCMTPTNRATGTHIERIKHATRTLMGAR